MSLFDNAAGAELVEAMTALSVSAAQAIRRQDASHLRRKRDGSPVTAADEAAEAVIREGLARLSLGVAVISEEQAERERPCVTGTDFIFIDPLDGTREFIAGRGEYTVNIGVVAGGQPIAGVIAAPALGLAWRGVVGRGAERLQFDGDRSGKIANPQTIRTRPGPPGELLVMTSRSHLDARTQAFVDALPQARRIACGSSIKFCRLAEGAADLYPRFGPTRDWDVAAGHAILAAAGGDVLSPEGAPLRYGSPELRIPAFVAFGDAKATLRAKVTD